MDYMLAACSLGALLVYLAVIGMIRGYDIELTFHPPVFFKVKSPGRGSPESLDGGTPQSAPAPWLFNVASII